MKPQPWKQLGWWVFIGASVTVTVVTAFNDGSGMAPQTGKQASKQVAKPSPRKQQAPDLVKPELEIHLDERLLLHGQPLREEGEVGNVFNAMSWHVEPPAPPPAPPRAPEKPAPPPKPTAPPMPFTYFGRYVDADVQVVMLVKGEQLYTVSEGDIIENIYRVERVAPGMVELTYLPLNIRQSIGTGDA